MCQRQRQRHRMRFFPMPRVGRSLTKDHRVERTDVDARPRRNAKRRLKMMDVTPKSDEFVL